MNLQIASETISKRPRIESIDLLRGIVMIIMALDHVRDYFHRDAFLFSPTDLNQTSAVLFSTRFITHYCAPVFVFLAGISAYLYGIKRTKKQLSVFLLKRGCWMVFVELFIVTPGWTFNPKYPVFGLQVIWAIGISMIVLAALVRMKRPYILCTAVLLIAGHNMMDTVNITGNGILSIVWAMLHRPANFTVGQFVISVRYPVLPWIGIISLGYFFGGLYQPGFDFVKRNRILRWVGTCFLIIFCILRSGNFYGDAAYWSSQRNDHFSCLSFLNVTKYPPSLLYTLITLGPAMIALSVMEKPLNMVTEKLTVFGRVPFFYYVTHIYLIHLLAIAGVMISGRHWSDMILSTSVNRAIGLKGYGFNLYVVYGIWFVLILVLYPCCKAFDRYKSNNLPTKSYLSYL